MRRVIPEIRNKIVLNRCQVRMQKVFVRFYRTRRIFWQTNSLIKLCQTCLQVLKGGKLFHQLDVFHSYFFEPETHF